MTPTPLPAERCPLCASLHPKTEAHQLFCIFAQLARACWPKEPSNNAQTETH
jgi:hypothetical protein